MSRQNRPCNRFPKTNQQTGSKNKKNLHEVENVPLAVIAPTTCSKCEPSFRHLQVLTGGLARKVKFSLKSSPSLMTITKGPCTTIRGATKTSLICENMQNKSLIFQATKKTAAVILISLH